MFGLTSTPERVSGKPNTTNDNTRLVWGFTKHELRTLKRLATPAKVQDFLNRIPFNFEKKGDTLM